MDLAAERLIQTPFVNSTLLPMLLLSLARQRHTPRTATTIYREYDYVIVGAGSAGSILAARLSEISCVSVLLLEAGGPPPLISEVPAIERQLWFSQIDWAYRTAPQRYTGGSLVNRQLVWPSGKTLGGSSVLNSMLAIRGSSQIYDDWAAQGAEGWSYEDVLPYFIKMEDNRDPEYVANGYHGVGGPISMHRPRYQSEIKDPIFEAAKQMGYKAVDVNGRSQIGYYDFQGTLRAGQRCSTAKAYLVPAENRTNLDILPNAFVNKVIIKNHRATGVQFEFQGSTYEVNAKREVIMSAGTTNTAQLLMLSGIGPRKELERFKIPVVADLPVGKNLQDHVGVPQPFTLNPTIPNPIVKLADPANIAQYIANRTGPLSSLILCSVLAFLHNEEGKIRKEVPDYQLYFAEVPVTSVQLMTGIREDVLEEVYGPYRGQATYTCISQILHPRSRGTVTLQSTNPRDPPVIDPNYFEDPADIRDIVEGLKHCMRIGTSAPLRRIGSTPYATRFPACAQYTDEDSYYWCLAKEFVVTFNHQVGTAKMGDPNDPTTVVDPQLRVKYIKGLRVVDASVMPIVPTGNTNLPTMMVAEKASDIIKSTIHCGDDYHQEEWNQPQSPSWPIHSGGSEFGDHALKPFPHNDGKPDFTETVDKWSNIYSPKPPHKNKIKIVTPWNNEIPPSVISDLNVPNMSGQQNPVNLGSLIAFLTNQQGSSPTDMLNLLLNILSMMPQNPSRNITSSMGDQQGSSSNGNLNMQQMQGNQQMMGNQQMQTGGILQLISNLLSQSSNGNQQSSASVMQQMQGNQQTQSIQQMLNNLQMPSNQQMQGNQQVQTTPQVISLVQQILKMVNVNPGTQNSAANQTENGFLGGLQNKLANLKSAKSQGKEQLKSFLGNKMSLIKNRDPDNQGISGVIGDYENLNTQGNERSKMNFMLNKIANLLQKKNKGTSNGNIFVVQDDTASLNGEGNEMNKENMLMNKLSQLLNKKNSMKNKFSSQQQATVTNDQGNQNSKINKLMTKLALILEKKNKKINIKQNIFGANSETGSPENEETKLNNMMQKLVQLMQLKNKGTLNSQVLANTAAQTGIYLQENDRNKFHFQEDSTFPNVDETDSTFCTKKICNSLINFMECQNNGQCSGDRDLTFALYLNFCYNESNIFEMS